MHGFPFPVVSTSGAFMPPLPPFLERTPFHRGYHPSLLRSRQGLEAIRFFLCLSGLFFWRPSFQVYGGRLLIGLGASTCGVFRRHLQVEVRAYFDWLLLHGLVALEFLATQVFPALDTIVL